MTSTVGVFKDNYTLYIQILYIEKNGYNIANITELQLIYYIRNSQPFWGIAGNDIEIVFRVVIHRYTDVSRY